MKKVEDEKKEEKIIMNMTKPAFRVFLVWVVFYIYGLIIFFVKLSKIIIHAVTSY